MELGQLLFQGSEVYEKEAYWASDGLAVLGSAIEDCYRPNFEGMGSNYGGETFENDVFIMRNYCWCDGEYPEHENGCPPNFIHKQTNIKISWYKHCGRGITANIELNGYEWALIIKDCIESLEKK